MSMPLIEYGRTGRCLSDVPVLDAHAHIGRFAVIEGPPLATQVQEMDRIGIDTAIISSVEGIFGDIVRGNDDVADAAARYPGRFLGYCHVSAQYPELLVPELERCFANPVFKGIKVYQVGTRYDHELFDAVWAFARERGIPVLAHTWGGDVTGLDRVAERHADVPFLIGHSGSGYTYQAYIDLAKRAPNLYLDLTYSREHTNMIEHFVEQIGVDRLVWGTDAPTFSMSHQIGKVLFARIPDKAKCRILHDTAARLFGLRALTAPVRP